MFFYCEEFAVIPSKLHILEDHAISQLKAFGHGLGVRRMLRLSHPDQQRERVLSLTEARRR